jgi:hypothetical protein
MLDMFLIVAPTLTQLHINYCTITRSPEEEFAIDAAVSKMVVLQSLSISGDCSTELPILRAATTFRDPHRDIWAYNPLPYVSLCHVPGVNPTNLPEALRATRWASVTVWGPQVGSADDALKQECRDIATARDIDLKIE